MIERGGRQRAVEKEINKFFAKSELQFGKSRKSGEERERERGRVQGVGKQSQCNKGKHNNHIFMANANAKGKRDNPTGYRTTLWAAILLHTLPYSLS